MKNIFFIKFMQDTMMKVKTVISEEKKHIRFADWSAHDVSVHFIIKENKTI